MWKVTAKAQMRVTFSSKLHHFLIRRGIFDRRIEWTLAMASTKNLSDASGEDHVDPWNVTSGSEKGIDYNKLIGIFLKLSSIVFKKLLKFSFLFQTTLDALKLMMTYSNNLKMSSPRKILKDSLKFPCITCWGEVCFSLIEIWTKSWNYLRMRSHSTCTLEGDLALPLFIWVILYHWCLHSINYSSIFHLLK